ncbi:MAG: hypothetical protein JNM69_28290 [Archangium sp.]|nr:hypothetical protein [Archangium sp.]
MRRWLPLLVAFVVTLPSLGAGFSLDDWAQRAVVNGQLTHTTRYALFNFGAGDAEALRPLIERGPFPWFTLPELKLRFLRPLSSALIVFDTEVFGSTAWPQHLHSTLWYLALTAIVLMLYRRLTPTVAVFAGVLFAIDDAHVMPTMWLANRNALVAVCFVWLGLWAHVRWREDGWKPGVVVSAVAFAFGLAAGETAVAGLAYVLAYELLARPQPWSSRLRALTPVVLVLAGYAVLYKVLNSGARGSATYLDPLSEPLTFLTLAVPRFFANVGTQAFGAPDVYLALPEAKGLLIASGVVAVPVALLAWRRWAPTDEAERRTSRWLLLGAAGSLLPTLATFPATRLLTAASLGLAPVVATLLRAAWRDTGLRRGLGVLWLGGAFVLQPLTQWLVMPIGFTTVSTRALEAVKALDAKPTERFVVLSSSEFVPAIYTAPLMADLGLTMPRTWHVWSMAPLPVDVRRTGERQVELSVIGGRMIDSVFEENFRNDNFPIEAGQRVVIDATTVTVLTVEGGKPTSVRFDLDLPVEAFSFVWWDGDSLARVQLPAIGARLHFPRTQTMFERLMVGKKPPVD